VEEGQESADALGNVRFPSGGKAHHDDDELVRGSRSDDLQGSRVLSLAEQVRHGVVDMVEVHRRPVGVVVGVVVAGSS